MVDEIRSFEIFDRWGTRIYYAKGDGAAWDGRFKGRLMNPAVFTYRLEVVFLDGTVQTYFGDLSLLR